MTNMNPIFMIDFYKVGHVQQYPEDVTKVFSNWTPRSTRIEGVEKVVYFGVQRVLDEINRLYSENFFGEDLDVVLREYRNVITATLGITNPKTDHIEQLWRHGSLPIRVFSLPEGTRVPLGIPAMVMYNTEPWAFWVPNYLETLLSNMLWKSMTSATIAYRYKKLFEKWAMFAGERDLSFTKWQGHDFSYRGMSGGYDAEVSGMGHLLSFSGTDTIPAILAAHDVYGAEYSCGGSVPATEHSVMCSGAEYLENGEVDEFKMFDRLINQVYPEGIISIVSDSFDLWKVLTNYIPRLKDSILNRNGKIVIRPDCYDDQTEILTNRGFVLFKNLKEDDLVAEYTQEGLINFTKPIRYYESDWGSDQDMIHFENENHVDLLVTPNHRMVRTNRHEPEIKEARDIKYFHGKDFIHAGFLRGNEQHITPEERLLIAFQADGSFNTTGPKNKVRFNFTKQRKIERMRELLEMSGFEYKETIEPARPKNTQFYVTLPNDAHKTFAWVLEKLDNISGSWAREFIEELSYWDSCIRSENRIKYDTTVEINAEVVQVLSTLSGYRTCFSEYEDGRKEHFSKVYTVHINKKSTSNGQSIRKSNVVYAGKVYCVQVNSGMIVVRRNGRVAVSGNSGDPVNIVCGDPNATNENERKGVLRLLAEVLGTSPGGGRLPMINNAGVIYGDAITYERAEQILFRMVNELRLSPYNMVFGIGSFTYEYVTRDTLGFAMKATAIERKDGKIYPIFKDPITDDKKNSKKSICGLPAVYRDENDELFVDQNVTLSELENCAYRLVFDEINGSLVNHITFDEIKKNMENS